MASQEPLYKPPKAYPRRGYSTVRIPDELRMRIKIIAVKRKVTMGDIIREGLENRLKHYAWMLEPKK